MLLPSFLLEVHDIPKCRKQQGWDEGSAQSWSYSSCTLVSCHVGKITVGQLASARGLQAACKFSSGEWPGGFAPSCLVLVRLFQAFFTGLRSRVGGCILQSSSAAPWREMLYTEPVPCSIISLLMIAY